MQSENHQLQETGSYEIDSLISTILWHKQSQQGDRIFISDWKGRLHILRSFEPGSRLKPLVSNKELIDCPILSMDINRSKEAGSNDQLIIGTAEGILGIYHVELEKLQVIGQDREKRSIAKVISIQDSPLIFTFSWEGFMTIWNSSEKECQFVHPLKANLITAEYVHPYIAILFGNNEIAFIDVVTYSQGSSIKRKPIGYNEPIRSMAFYGKNIEYLAFGDIYGGIKVLKRKSDKEDLKGLSLIYSNKTLIDCDYDAVFSYKAHCTKIPQEVKEKHMLNPKIDRVVFPVKALDFNPRNPTIVASAGGDWSIYIADIDSEKGNQNNSYIKNSKVCPFTGQFTHLKYNEEGKALITVEKDGQDVNFKETDVSKLRSTVRLLKFLQ